ncbi:MAG: MBL fold metallo-hydrolase [Oscillospiraceae bacterium]|nr:MBL fold metallo-hydrolase [Oscillospiraceae bacterium]
MPKLFYQGHGSFRLTADDGRIIYIDPYKGTDESYSLPADLILVTHQHHDHNQIDRCAKNPDCRIITNEEALTGGKHNHFNVGGIVIHAVQASNKNHDPAQCVGYIITLDSVKIYASGDTSRTDQMERFAGLEIDYALFPGDGKYNMGPEEAAECARLIKAKNNILIHVKPDESVLEIAEGWDAPNKLILEPGQEINLK